MNRRRFLAIGGNALTAGFAGCTEFLDDDPPGRPWSPSEPIEDPEGLHHLFVENHTESTEVAWLRVVREDEAHLVDGRYELPDGRAIRFDEIAAWESTYAIEIAIDGEEARTFEWTTDECGPESEASGESGSRNAAVRVEAASEGDEHISLRVDQCDAIDAGSVPAGSAETFRLDE